MRRLVLAVALLSTSTAAKADEFADVNPERLAKGIEILAEQWTIPIAVYHGATDDFARSGTQAAAPIPVPAPIVPAVSGDSGPAWACRPDPGGLADRLRYDIPSDCLPDAISRRQD